jgi:hypothetical protein
MFATGGVRGVNVLNGGVYPHERESVIGIDSAMRTWRCISRGYAILCIVVTVGIDWWNWSRPGRPGIPREIRALVPLVIAGVAAFPVFVLIELFLWVLKCETLKPVLLSIAICLAAAVVCLSSVS